jgi:3-mercaptopyruvate sulfurtransferase SseA
MMLTEHGVRRKRLLLEITNMIEESFQATGIGPTRASLVYCRTRTSAALAAGTYTETLFPETV